MLLDKFIKLMSLRTVGMISVYLKKLHIVERRASMFLHPKRFFNFSIIELIGMVIKQSPT